MERSSLGKFSIFVMILLFFLFSLSVVSAADHTINTGSSGGIAQGIGDTGDGDTLFLETGTYNKNSDRNITINKNITIQGKGSSGNVVIDAQKQSRIFLTGDGLKITFINITFTNAYSYEYLDGGAIHNNQSQLTFINCIFKNNNASMGAAIYNSGSNMAVINSSFINNAGFSLAGGIFNSGSNMIVINSTFQGNKGGFYGGAIDNNASNMTIVNSSFTNNNGNYGGAINYGVSSINVFNSIFINNTAIHEGGAIYADYNSSMIIVNSSFINNTARYDGGAIYKWGRYNDGYNNTIIDSSFINNTARRNGGAIYNYNSTMNVSNSSFSNNQANYGGSIYNEGDMFVSNNTMEGNTAMVLGNEIYNAGNMSVLNLTFIDNSTWIVKNGDIISLYATLTDDMGNLITGGNISFYVNGNFIGNGSVVEGKANVNYTVNRSGKFPVTGNYTGTNNTINIKNGVIIDKIETNITINAPENNTVNKTFNITGKLTDKNNTPIKNATVIITIDNRDYIIVTDALGRYILSYAPNKAGQLNISVKYSGDDIYFFSSNNLSVFSKIETNISLNVSKNNTVNKTFNISGILVDKNNNPLKNVTVVISIDNVDYFVVTDDGGRYILSYTPTKIGKLNISVKYSGSDIHFYSGNNLSVFSKIETNISVNAPVNNTVNKSFNISGILVDKNNNPLKNVTVVISIDNVDYFVVTDDWGRYILSYTPTRTGQLNISVNYSESDGYFSSSNNLSVFTKLESNIIVNAPVNNTVNKTFNITGILTDKNNKPVKNATITITINNKKYTVLTDDGGRYILSYTPTRTGQLNISVYYSGGDVYSSSSNILFVFSKIKTNMVVNVPKNITVNKTFNITGILTDNNNKPVKNAKVIITIANKKYAVFTDSLGRYSLSYTPTEIKEVDSISKLKTAYSMSYVSDRAGWLNIFVSYLGDDGYFSSSISLSVFVKNSTIPEPNNSSDENKSSNNSDVHASMKKTGIPAVAILLVLLVSLVLIGRRKL